MVRTKRISKLTRAETSSSSRTPSLPPEQAAPVTPAAPQQAELNPNEMGFVYRDNIQFESLEQVKRANAELPCGTLTFRLKNVDRHLTPREFGRVFDVSCESSAEVDREFSTDMMWSTLIGQTEVFVKEGNASRMQDPRDRMLYAFLACTLTSRGRSTHKVTKEDLFLLWCYKENHPVNAAGWIMSRMYKTALKEKGDIMIGGYVTRIARYLGIEVTDEDEEYQNPYVDQQHGIGTKVLVGSRVIRKLDEPIVLAELGMLSSELVGHPRVQGRLRPKRSRDLLSRLDDGRPEPGPAGRAQMMRPL